MEDSILLDRDLGEVTGLEVNYFSKVAALISAETNLCVLGDMVQIAFKSLLHPGTAFFVRVMAPSGKVGVVDVRYDFTTPFIRSVKWGDDAVDYVNDFVARSFAEMQ